MLRTDQALVLTLVMAAAIFLCRVFPFLFFRGASGERAGPLLGIVEKIVPPAAMTVLAFNAISVSIKDDLRQALPVLIASLFTALAHLWRRNALISITGGVVIYMALQRLL